MAVIHPQGILDKFDFLIDGRAKKQIEVFIKKKPKFEEICKELEVKNCKHTSKKLSDFISSDICHVCVHLCVHLVPLESKQTTQLKLPEYMTIHVG